MLPRAFSSVVALCVVVACGKQPTAATPAPGSAPPAAAPTSSSAAEPTAAASAADAGPPTPPPEAHPFAKTAAETGELIGKAVDGRIDGMWKCVEETRARRKDPHAKIVVELGIDQEGTLIGVKSPNGVQADETLYACVREALRDAPFPRSNTGVITIKKTFEDVWEYPK